VFDVKRRSLTLFPLLPKPEVVYNGQTVADIGPYIVLKSNRIRMPLGTEVGLGPGDIMFDGDAPPPTERGTAPLPTFWAMSVVAKRSPISTTAELLYSPAVKYKTELLVCLWCVFV